MYSGEAAIDTPRVASPDHTTTAADFSLPSLDLQMVARRAALPLALAAAALAVVLLAGGPIGVLADALGRALSADPRWIALAAAAELLSFGGYIALFWLVGRRATPRLDLRAGVEITLGGAAATRLLPTAGVGGAALTLWAINKTGMGTKRAGRVLLTFLSLLYGMFLLGIALSGAAIALGLGGGTGHAVLAGAAALAAGLAIGVALALAARDGEAGEDAGRVARGAALLGSSVRDALGLVRSGDARLLGAPAWWAFDAAVLWATFNALGEPPALAVLAFAYFAGQVGNTIPVPGAVSGGMVGTLLAFGVAPDLALSSVLAYRAVAIWLPAPLGLAALGALRSRVARWSREDADAADLVEAIVAPALIPAADLIPAAPARRVPVRQVPCLTSVAACSGSA
jgi:putative heme transporter